MNFLRFTILVTTVISINIQTTFSQSLDTIRTPQSDKVSMEAFFATSLSVNKNWRETNYSSILFSGNFRVLSSEKASVSRVSEFRLELAYQKFFDSTWIKTDDRFLYLNTWLLDQRKIKQSYTLNFTTQLTDTWLPDFVSNELQWKSGPLLPATIITGYGLFYKFDRRNFLNISFPSFKTGSLPPKKNYTYLKLIRRFEKFIVYNDYGLNIQYTFDQTIGSKIVFQSDAFFFMSFSTKSNMYFDVQNILSITPIKKLKIRFENKIIKDDFYGEKLQLKYELLIGLDLLLLGTKY